MVAQVLLVSETFCQHFVCCESNLTVVLCGGVIAYFSPLYCNSQSSATKVVPFNQKKTEIQDNVYVQ